MRSLLVYLAVVFFGAALLSPWVYWLAQSGAGHSGVLARLSAQPFHRYVNRCLLALAIIGLSPFLKSLGANSWPAVGLVAPAGNGYRLAGGFALGFLSLASVALLAIIGGARSIKVDLSAVAFTSKLVSAGVSALVVGFLEELLFRGALFGALRKAHPWVMALGVSSAIYALVHFFQRPPSPAHVTWTSGFATLLLMSEGFGEFQMLVPGFFALFLAGMILGLAYQRTGNLYLSIGLHAGWIFWLKFYGSVTLPNPQTRQWFWGSSKLIDGWLALVVLVPVLVLIGLFPVKLDSTRHAV